MSENENQKLPDAATAIMAAMVKMPPRPHKDESTPKNKRGDAQRRRRESERLAASLNDVRAESRIQPQKGSV